MGGGLRWERREEEEKEEEKEERNIRAKEEQRGRVSVRREGVDGGSRGAALVFAFTCRRSDGVHGSSLRAHVGALRDGGAWRGWWGGRRNVFFICFHVHNPHYTCTVSIFLSHTCAQTRARPQFLNTRSRGCT